MSTNNVSVLRTVSRKRLLKKIAARWQIYLLLLVPVGFLIVFQYIPMGGILLAFKKYDFSKGILGSPWVGLDNFIKFFESRKFILVLRNTLTISLYSLLAGFPIPIIFALLLNALPWNRYKKTIQTVTYVPYFISTVVMVGLVLQILNYRNGLYGSLYSLFFHTSAPDLLSVGKNFKHIYVWSVIWQSTGYNAIIYLASLAGVDQALHEAALIDGATRFQRVIHIDFPSILPTASIMMILAVGGIMDVGFTRVLLMQNSLNLDYSEVISTYVYKIGLASGVADFSYSTAVSTFNSLVSFVLLILANWGSKRLSGSSIF